MDTGCQFCGKERHRIMEVFSDGIMEIVSANGHYAIETEDNDATTNLMFTIFYCPMCGKRLEETKGAD